MTQQRINRNRGKSHERAVAKDFKGQRRGVLGGCDVLTKLYGIECKSRKKFVGVKWMEQAIRNAEEFNVIPMVNIHVLNTKHKDNWVCLRQSDFLEMYVGENG